MSETEITPNQEVEEQDDSGELRFRRSSLYAALLPLAFVTGLAAGYLFWGREGSAPVVAANPTDTEEQVVVAEPAQTLAPTDSQQVRLEIDEDNDPFLGPEDAPITIIEFSDFRCPFCKRFRQETFDQLFEAYPEQIRFIYRDFPVVGGFEAAVASECANEQAAYWDYHDLLFSDGYAELNREAFLGYADQLSLDIEAFTLCLEEERYADEVENDARYAAGLGVTGTPTFFINGIPVVGAQPFLIFADIIDAELEG